MTSLLTERSERGSPPPGTTAESNPDGFEARTYAPPSRSVRLRRLQRRYSPLGEATAHVGLAWRRWLWLHTRDLSFTLKRGVDLTISVGLLVLLAPILIPALLAVYARGGRLVRDPRVGRHLRRFDMFRFETNEDQPSWIRKLGLDHLPVLFNVVKGDMAIVGPRPITPDELELSANAGRRRHTDRPGCLCLWWIRRRANIDYGSEAESDAEYVDGFSFRTDLGIMARAMLAAIYGDRSTADDARVRILGIPVDNVSLDGAVDQIVELTELADRNHRICFVNADCANIACRNPQYRDSLESADRVYADGIGMKMAGRFLKTGVRQNVNGTDLFPRLCERMGESGKRLFLLGAKPGVADRVGAWVEQHHPNVNLCGVQHGYFSESDLDDVLASIRDARPDVLLVAFGAPKQDLWIQRHLKSTGARVAIGVGGLFDFYSGDVSRAPLWMREIGMEWVWRFLQEPQRMWKRYFLGNGVFLFRVFCERLRLFRVQGRTAR